MPTVKGQMTQARGDPPPLFSYGMKKSLKNEVEAMLKERDLAINALKENLCAAQNRLKKNGRSESKRVEV